MRHQAQNPAANPPPQNPPDLLTAVETAVAKATAAENAATAAVNAATAAKSTASAAASVVNVVLVRILKRYQAKKAKRVERKAKSVARNAKSAARNAKDAATTAKDAATTAKDAATTAKDAAQVRHPKWTKFSKILAVVAIIFVLINQGTTICAAVRQVHKDTSRIVFTSVVFAIGVFFAACRIYIYGHRHRGWRHWFVKCCTIRTFRLIVKIGMSVGAIVTAIIGTCLHVLIESAASPNNTTTSSPAPSESTSGFFSK